MNNASTKVSTETHPPRYVSSADGTRLWAFASGTRPSTVRNSNADIAPNGRKSFALVLIHGFTVIGEAFEPMFQDEEWLKHTFLVAYDTRGHGRSDKPLGDAAWESKRIAEDFEAVCGEFEIEETFVLGWSLGSTHFTDILANNTPSRIKILGFINVAGPPYIEVSPTPIPRYANTLSAKLLPLLPVPPSVDAFCEVVLAIPDLCSRVLKPELKRKLLEGHLMQPRGVVLPLITRRQDLEAYRKAGQEGKIGLLAVLGEKDEMMSPPKLREYVEEVGWAPGKFTMKMMPDADHMPWVSSPAGFRTIVLGWMWDQVGMRL